MVEGVPGGLDGEVDVGLVALGDVGDDLAGARVPGLERLTCGEEYNGQLYFLFHSRKFRCFCFHRLEHGKPNCLSEPVQLKTLCIAIAVFVFWIFGLQHDLEVGVMFFHDSWKHRSFC